MHHARHVDLVALHIIQLSLFCCGISVADNPEDLLRGSSGQGWWGPKTATEDAPYYLPESLIGELPYRYQGVALHGLMGLLPGFWGRYNLGYAGLSSALGRTARVHRPEDQMPPAPPYPGGGTYPLYSTPQPSDIVKALHKKPDDGR